MSSAPHRRSATTTSTGIPSSRMAWRLVPLPDARTPILTVPTLAAARSVTVVPSDTPGGRRASTQRRVNAALRSASAAGRFGAGVRLHEPGFGVAGAEEPHDAASDGFTLDLLYVGSIQQVGLSGVADVRQFSQGRSHAVGAPEH